MNQPQNTVHRSIVVHVWPAAEGASISVIARTQRGTGRRHEHLCWRGRSEPVDVSDMPAIMRAAGAAVSKAAESL